jgi:protein-disulfide isomerase
MMKRTLLGNEAPINTQTKCSRLRLSFRRRTASQLGLSLLLAVAVLSQSPSSAAHGSSEEPGITKDQANDILQELREIRHLLEKQSNGGSPTPLKTVPHTGKMRLDGGYSIGSEDAPLTVVEFTDYECQFCRQFESATFAELRKKYVETGKVRFLIRDFPLTFHASAMKAAEAARCAGDQGKFWQMHDALFTDPPKLDAKQLAQHAQDLKLNAEMFRTCLDSGKHKSDVQNDMQSASALQIMGTPSFLIGRAKDGELSGDILMGAQPLSVFEARLKEVEAR